MRIKIIAAYIGKINNIGFTNGMLMGNQRFADPELFKMLAEGMDFSFGPRCSGLIDGSHLANHSRRTLNRYTAQVMKHPSFPAHFFASSCTSGSPVRQHWQR